MSDHRSPPLHQSGIVIFIAIIAVLYAAQDVFIPVALATLFAFLLTPLVNRVQRRGVGNVFSVLLVGGGVFMVIMGVLWLVAGQFRDLMTDFPKYQKNVKEKLSLLSDSSAGALAGSVSNITHDLAAAAPVPPAAPQPATTPGSMPDPDTDRSKHRNPSPSNAKSPSPPTPLLVKMDDHPSLRISDFLGVLSSALHPVIEGGLILLLSLFMLIRRKDLHARFLVLSNRVNDPSRQPISAHAIDEAITTISRYLWMQSVSNAVIASIILSGLFILGVPNALLWGLLCFLLRFIPYLGIIIAASSVSLFAVAVSPDWTTPMWVAILFFTSEMLFNSLLEPLFFARGTGLSSIAILIAATFWTWLWGTAGLFLSIPLTVCWMVMGRNYGHFAFLEILLGNRPLTAADAVGGHAHLQNGGLQPLNEQEIRAAQSEKTPVPVGNRKPSTGPTTATTASPSSSSRAFPADEPHDDGKTSAEKPVERTPEFMCIAADSDLDALSCSMMCQMLDTRHLLAINPSDARPHDILNLIEVHHISAVCICALSGVSQQRAIDWGQVLRLRFPELFVIVGIWGTAPAVISYGQSLDHSGLHIVRDMREAVDMLQSQSALMASAGVL